MAINKAIKWVGKAYLQTFVFCALVAAAIGAMMTFIAYPIETLTALFIALVLAAVGVVVFG